MELLFLFFYSFLPVRDAFVLATAWAAILAYKVNRKGRLDRLRMVESKGRCLLSVII
jgi:hypothetical protein